MQLLFWSGYLSYAILLQFASFKERKKKKKSLSKQNHNSHTFLNSDYISTLRHSLFNNNSKILALAQKLYLYSLAGVKDQTVHDGWGEGVQ